MPALPRGLKQTGSPELSEKRNLSKDGVTFRRMRSQLKGGANRNKLQITANAASKLALLTAVAKRTKKTQSRSAIDNRFVAPGQI